MIERESYLRRASRYIVVNPVRSGTVPHASTWEWSSYRATAGLEPPPPFLHVDWIDWAFPGASREESQLQYRLYVNDALTKTSRLDVAASVLGTRGFESALRQTIGADDTGRSLPRGCRALARPILATLFSDASESRPERDRRIREAHVVYRYRLAEIATFLGLHPSTATLAVRRLEAAEAEKNS